MARQSQFMEFAPSGFNSDVAAYTVPPDTYSLTRNVRFNGSSAERMGGSRLIYTQAQPYIGNPEFIFTTVINGLPWLLYGGDWGVAVTNGTNHYNVTPAGWNPISVPGSVTGGAINNVICFNHPDNVPYYWDGTTVAGAVKPLPGWPASTYCRVLRVYRSNLFAGDILSAGGRQQDRLLWSDFAPVNGIPPTWTPTATNAAGEMNLADGVGSIVEAQPLHDFLMVYKNAAAYAVSFVGRPYIYSFRRMAAAVGAVSPNAVCVLRGSHVVIGNGDVVLLDGANARSLIDQRVRKALFSDFNANAAGVACTVHYPAKSEVWVCIPTVGSELCNRAGVWNYNTDKWTIRDLPNLSSVAITLLRPDFVPLIWSTQTQAWNATQGNWSGIRYAETNVKVVGASPQQSGAIAFDMDDLELGQPFEGTLQRLSLPIGGTATLKHFTHIYPRISGTNGSQVLCRIGVQVDISDPIAWGPERPITVDSSNPIKGMPVLAQGRYLSINMRSYQTPPWTVDGFGVEYQERSRY